MGNEIVGVSKGRLGIKRVTNEKVLFPKTFGQCGKFSFSEIIKEYVTGEGIVIRNIEYEIYYFCLHKAFPDNLGGMCAHNNYVCKDCIVMCELCGSYLCIVPGCCNPIIVEGKIICQEHLEEPKFLGLF